MMLPTITPASSELLTSRALKPSPDTALVMILFTSTQWLSGRSSIFEMGITMPHVGMFFVSVGEPLRSSLVIDTFSGFFATCSTHWVGQKDSSYLCRSEISNKKAESTVGESGSSDGLTRQL